MIQGFGGFLLLLGAGWGCGCGAGHIAGAGPGFRCILFLSANHDEYQIIKLNEKQKYPKLEL